MSMQYHPGYPDRISNRARMQSNRLLAYQSQAANSGTVRLKYSKPSETDGSRLLLVCDVALGQCTDVHKKDLNLTEVPEGYDSVHGFCRTPNTHSEFVLNT
ncbi:hypothetical protein NQZ68_021667 [Dissostichus eleginoides]|nr:hypothetical protein NQZ68_021667 [Dissostichus eleginoides]